MPLAGLLGRDYVGGRFPGMRWFWAKMGNADETPLWGEGLKRIFSLERKCISFWIKRAFSLHFLFGNHFQFASDYVPIVGKNWNNLQGWIQFPS